MSSQTFEKNKGRVSFLSVPPALFIGVLTGIGMILEALYGAFVGHADILSVVIFSVFGIGVASMSWMTYAKTRSFVNEYWSNQVRSGKLTRSRTVLYFLVYAVVMGAGELSAFLSVYFGWRVLWVGSMHGLSSDLKSVIVEVVFLFITGVFTVFATLYQTFMMRLPIKRV